MAQHIYGRKKSILDGTERIFDHEKHLRAAALPEDFDLRPKCPPVYDQGNEGSCSANAGVFARVMLLMAALHPDATKVEIAELSRAFLYFMERKLEGTTSEDSGASMKDIITACVKYGICPETDMPYVAGQFAAAPSKQAIKDALAYKIKGGQMVQGIQGIQTALVTQSQPVLMGMNVYASMESESVASSGVLPIPKKGEELLGGHAVAIVGYTPDLPKDTAKKVEENCFKEILDFLQGERKPDGYMIVRNSWGADWGVSGYFFMPYEYITAGYADEFWIME